MTGKEHKRLEDVLERGCDSNIENENVFKLCSFKLFFKIYIFKNQMKILKNTCEEKLKKEGWGENCTEKW